MESHDRPESVSMNSRAGTSRDGKESNVALSYKRGDVVESLAYS